MSIRRSLAHAYQPRLAESGLSLTSWLERRMSAERVLISHWLRRLGVAWILRLHRSWGGASRGITFTHIFPEQQRDTRVSRQEWCFGFEPRRRYMVCAQISAFE